jgi:hypothetical protein
LILTIYCKVPAGEALGGGSVGFCTGALVGVGKGGVGSSTTILGDGDGSTGAFLVFELSLALIFAPLGLFGSSVGEVTGEAVGLGLGSSVGLMMPPAGIPDSGLPVGGLAASTGWPFGSAVKVEGVVSVVD